MDEEIKEVAKSVADKIIREKTRRLRHFKMAEKRIPTRVIFEIRQARKQRKY